MNDFDWIDTIDVDVEWNDNKIKVTEDDFFGGWSRVSLKGKSLSPNNVEDYDLIKMFENEEQAIYKISYNDEYVIVHDKKKRNVDWFDDSWEGYSCGYCGWPEEYFEQSKGFWVKVFNPRMRSKKERNRTYKVIPQ